jgi:hypothetical protein
VVVHFSLARQPHGGLVGAADGRGPPVTLLVAGALVVVMVLLTIGLVTEPCDTVPRGASETADDSVEEGMSTPSEREPRRTTVTAMEIPRAARMEMRKTNQWRRQNEAVWGCCLRCGGTRWEVEAAESDGLWWWWIDRECDSENEWDGCLGLDDGRASEAMWEYGGDGERVTKCVRLGTGGTAEMVSLSLTGT